MIVLGESDNTYADAVEEVSLSKREMILKQRPPKQQRRWSKNKVEVESDLDALDISNKSKVSCQDHQACNELEKMDTEIAEVVSHSGTAVVVNQEVPSQKGCQPNGLETFDESKASNVNYLALGQDSDKNAKFAIEVSLPDVISNPMPPIQQARRSNERKRRVKRDLKTSIMPKKPRVSSELGDRNEETDEKISCLQPEVLNPEPESQEPRRSARERKETFKMSLYKKKPF